jgi:DnaJ-class molecular chaperone
MNDLLLVDAIDFYALLNISKSASEADVKAAYKRLCVSFHPVSRKNDF